MKASVQNIEQQLMRMDEQKKVEKKITIDDFSQVDLVHKETGIIHKIAKNERLALLNNILNPNGHLYIKGTGLRLKAPILQDAFVVDIATYSVTLKNTQDPSGKYKQDVGLGKDASLSITISFKVDDDEKYINKLIKQQDSYKGAIRTSCETIMRLLILQHFKKNSHEEIDLSQYNDMKKIILDIVALAESAKTTTLDDINTQIISEAMKLYNVYGIKLTRLNITDMDLPNEIQEIISENRKQAEQRKLEEKQAEIDRKIAENKAEAEYIKNVKQAEAEYIKYTKEYQALKEIGLSQEQIFEIIGRKSLPGSTVNILNSSEKNSRLTDIITAGTVINKQK